MQINNAYYTTSNSTSQFQSRITSDNNRIISFSAKGDEFCKKSKPVCNKIMDKLKHFFWIITPKKFIKRTPKIVLPPNNLPPIEKIDGSDFSKLEGEIISWSGEKVVKDENGTIIRKLYSNNRKKLTYVVDYNPLTNRPLRGASYCSDGKTLSSIVEYDPRSKNFSRYFSYKEDGKTLDFEIRYAPKDETVVQKIWYEDDGITIKKIEQKQM